MLGGKAKLKWGQGGSRKLPKHLNNTIHISHTFLSSLGLNSLVEEVLNISRLTQAAARGPKQGIYWYIKALCEKKVLYKSLYEF